jgi:hypothetical protein
MNEQITPLYLLIYYFNLHHLNTAMTLDQQTTVFGCLKDHVPANSYEGVESAFLNFRARRVEFAPSNVYWKGFTAFIKSTKFLQIYLLFSSILADLAIRLFDISANSVSSEWVFSAMNFQATRNRNRINVEKIDILIYISLHYRAFSYSHKFLAYLTE